MHAHIVRLANEPLERTGVNRRGQYHGAWAAAQRQGVSWIS
jgi:hypothetical protein